MSSGCQVLITATGSARGRPRLRDATAATRFSSIFARGHDSRLWHRISAVGIGNKRRWGIHGELVGVRRHFEVAVEHLVKGHFPAGVGGHAPHARNQAGFNPAFHLVVGLIVSNGVHQIIPFVLIGVLLLRFHLGFPKHFGGQVLACIQA